MPSSQLYENAFAYIPTGVLAMAQLTMLTVTPLPPLSRSCRSRGLQLSGNRLVALPREIGRLAALTELWVRSSLLPPRLR